MSVSPAKPETRKPTQSRKYYRVELHKQNFSGNMKYSDLVVILCCGGEKIQTMGTATKLSRDHTPSVTITTEKILVVKENQRWVGGSEIGR